MSAQVTNRVRVGGSGFTYFSWMNQIIAFARQVSHTSPEPVGPGPVAIQPLNAKRPIQVITPGAAGMGTLVVELYELYGAQVWEQLIGLSGTLDLVEIFQAVAAMANPISMSKTIVPPVLQGVHFPSYSEVYHNCVITNVANGETIEVGTMEIRKQITVAYTNMITDRGSEYSIGYGANEPTVAVSQ